MSTSGVRTTITAAGNAGARHPGNWGSGLRCGRVTQALPSSSASRLRVRVKSSGMPGPIVVDMVAFSM